MKELVLEAAEFIRGRSPLQFKWGIILGSGLGALADEVVQRVTIDYSSIPHFPQSRVPGHEGQMVCGFLGGVPVVVLKGRVHYYEGYQTSEVAFPVRVFKALGIANLCTTNAVGGLRHFLKVGDIMLVQDHINFLPSPLKGPHDPFFGERFPSLFRAYDPMLQDLAEKAASKVGIPLKKGVLASVPGPHFETLAELKALRIIGADAVGMSVTPETIAARQMEMKVLAFSVITDLDPSLGVEELSHDAVLKAAREAASNLAKIIKEVISLHEGS